MRVHLLAALMVDWPLRRRPSRKALPRSWSGTIPSLSGAPLYIALEKGYTGEAGIDVQLEMSGTSSEMAVLLATNRIQVIGGAISAGFFNSLGKEPSDRPADVAGDQPLCPLPDDPSRICKGKLREPADLKGRTVAVAARGAILLYELAKVLESAGLSLADVELKYIPFGQMPTALTTGAVDAA